MEHATFIDIETIPAQSAEALERARADVKPPGNIKKQESIDAWLADNREQAAREALAKTSFDPAQGHICTIGWAMDNDEPVTAHARDVQDERDVLGAFFGALRPYDRHTFVGHYISGFDLRFILCRSVVLGVRIPPCVPRDPKPWAGTVFDTMTAWSGQRGTISLDNLCAALGIPGKDGFDGSQVAEAWASGEHERITEYCADDVRRVRAVWQRFQAAGWDNLNIQEAA